MFKVILFKKKFWRSNIPLCTRVKNNLHLYLKLTDTWWKSIVCRHIWCILFGRSFCCFTFNIHASSVYKQAKTKIIFQKILPHNENVFRSSLIVERFSSGHINSPSCTQDTDRVGAWYQAVTWYSPIGCGCCLKYQSSNSHRTFYYCRRNLYIPTRSSSDTRCRRSPTSDCSICKSGYP